MPFTIRVTAALVSCLAGGLLSATDVHASTPSSRAADPAKTETDATPAKKRVSIHLESYADKKSAATAHEFAALLEERLASRKTPQPRKSQGKNEDKPAGLKAAAKGPAHPAID